MAADGPHAEVLVVVMHSLAGPCRVSLSVLGEDHPAIALELSGNRAALRVRRALDPASPVRLTLDWSDGASTSLPANVTSVSESRDDGSHVAHVDLLGVEGDWIPFLEDLGPSAAGAA
jgi:hypothetical protein